MRKGLAIGMAAFMTFMAFAVVLPTATALDVIDEVDIGDLSSEDDHGVSGWGPIEPATHGGGWGGASSGILDTGDTDLRTVWAPSIGDDNPSASLTLSTGDYVGTTLFIIALDGLADDSFDVYVGEDLVYSYEWSGSTSEFWVEHGIPVHIDPGMTITVTITATADAWGGIDTWGQLGIAYVALMGYESGYDEYGYNYQAHMFNGYFSNYNRPEIPWTKDNIENAPDDSWLMMKWSDTWLSNQDRNGDGNLDRGIGPDYDSSAADGAWLTNHQRGVDENGKKWTYFVKIVYPTGGPVDVDPYDGYDDNTGGEIIWGAYIIVKEVFSGSGSENYVKPQGWGAL
jgi:hypothetical protein